MNDPQDFLADLDVPVYDVVEKRRRRTRLTRRGWIVAAVAAGFALGSWNWLWEQVPWAV